MSASPDLARLLALIAHELRTPLSVASGYVKMLSSERPGPLNDAQRTQLAGASRSCDHLTALAADISLLGRLERGEITPRPVSIDPTTLVAEIVAGHVVNPEHPVKVEAARGPGDGTPMLHVDAMHVRRTLTALVAAVVRGAPDTGTVRIAWHVPPQPSSSIRIGIALADRIDAFLRQDDDALDPLDESIGGLGMALPLARQLMALEGGIILAARPPLAPGLRLALPRSPDSRGADC